MMMKNLKKITIKDNIYYLDYLNYSWRYSLAENKEYKLYNINIYVKDKFTNPVNVQEIIDMLKVNLPEVMFEEIDAIYIGNFEMLISHDLNALYSDGAIYVSNVQDNEQDLIDDIVHEIGHALESKYSYIIYGDGKLEQEFISKRVRLYTTLKDMGYEPNQELFLNSEYNKELDLYLYKEVGYDTINIICANSGFFTSAYATTSIREYYASGFEYYFLDERKYLKQICPRLHEKIRNIHEQCQDM